VPVKTAERIQLKQLANRLYLGLGGLCVFWGLGMLSANELAKSSILMATCLPGVTGLFLLIPYFRRRPRWLSSSTLFILFLFFLDAALKGFLRDYFGLRPNPVLVLQAIFNTNPGETDEFFRHNWRDVAEAASTFATVMMLAVYGERRLSRGEAGNPSATPQHGARIAIAGLLSAFFALHFNPTMAKENPLLFWPIRYLDYREQVIQAGDMQRRVDSNMAQRTEWQVQYKGPPRNTVVWVIGESLNRSNMSLYGYPRNTTPMLDAMRNELLVFNDVVSSDPATMSSLMKILTPADLDEPEAWNQKPDVLMQAKEAGYKTFWLSNQVPNDGWLGLVSNRADERLFINKGAGRGENNFDGNLFPGFEAALANPAPKKFIVVHLLGAHPTYEMRYPKEFSKFDGVTDPLLERLSDAGRSAWILHLRNKYDNAIAYNDYVVANLLHRTMKIGADGNASLLFNSDHGQEVGHTRNHAGQSVVDASGYEIPMVLWTRSFLGKNPTEKAVLENRPYQTDHLEHTMMRLLGIQSRYYHSSRDLLSTNFSTRLRRINEQEYKPVRIAQYQ